jgi:uncharacterized protein YxjI
MHTPIMGTTYVIGRRQRHSHTRPITDDSGTLRFEVQDSGKASSVKLSIRDTEGTEVAAISHEILASHYELLADGQRITMRACGLLGRHLEINSAADRLEVVGNYRSRQPFSITRGGMPTAAVTLRKQFAVEVTDGEDPVLMLGVALTIASVKADRAKAMAAAGG